MKTKGDKNQIEISSLSEGKGIIRDVISMLKEAEMVFKEALDIGDEIFLKKFPVRIIITLKSVQKINEIFDTVLVCDGN